MKIPVRLMGAVACIALLVTGCGDSSDDTSSGGAVAAGLPEDLVEAAKKEGSLALVTSTNINASDSKIYDAFSQAYGIEVTQLTGSSAEVNSKILAERSQDVYNYDMAVLGEEGMTTFLEAGAFTPLVDDIVVPDVLEDRSDWYAPERGYMAADADREYILDYKVRVQPNVARTYYNTEKVTEADIEALTSFQDLATDPRWKDKIVVPKLDESSNDGALGSLQYSWMSPNLGPEWFTELFENNTPEVVGPGQPRQIVDGLARGQWELCLFCNGVAADATTANQDGLPVAELAKTLEEGPTADTTGSMAVFDETPHPNAAKLFANWILSEEGQEAINLNIDADVAAGAAAMRKSAPQGNQPDSVWTHLQETELKFATPQELQKAGEEIQEFIQDLFAKHNL